MEYEKLQAMKVEDMNRTQLIEAIRYHAHPTWFHDLLSASTPRLKALLVFWRESEKEGIDATGARNFMPTLNIAINHTEIKLQ